MQIARYGRRKISDLVAEISRPLFQKAGLIDERLVMYWTEIVGEKLAKDSFPLKLVGNPLQPNMPRILEVQVTSGAALEFSYAKHVVMAKINQFFGYALVTEIRFKQGFIANQLKKKQKEVSFRKLGPDEENFIQENVNVIEEESLRNALKNLGKALLSRRKET